MYTYHISYNHIISYHITQPCSALSPRPGLPATHFFSQPHKTHCDFLSWSLRFKLATPLVRGSCCSETSRVLGVLGSRPAASHSPTARRAAIAEATSCQGARGSSSRARMTRKLRCGKGLTCGKTELYMLPLNCCWHCMSVLLRRHRCISSSPHFASGLPVHGDKCVLQHCHDHRQWHSVAS